MDTYIKNLLPRLKQYGQKLNKIESFVDKIWVLYDDTNGFQTFRFQRSGKLLITVKGRVEEHIWEYLPPDSLYLKRGGPNGIMCRQAFFLDSLFVMQLEGTESEVLLFYNETEIPDGNVPLFLLKMYAEKNNKFPIGSENKYFLEGGVFKLGSKVYDNKLRLLGNKNIAYEDKLVTISNGTITKVSFVKYLMSEKGRLKISSPEIWDDNWHDEILNADVCLESGVRLEGKIKITEGIHIGYIDVRNGKIIQIENAFIRKYSLVILIIIISAILYYFYY